MASVAELGVVRRLARAMRKKHLRPAHEFTVTSLAWERDIEAKYRRAGFAPIPDEVLVRRFWQFLRFIQQYGLTTRTLANSPDELTDDATLRNSDLTDKRGLLLHSTLSRALAQPHSQRLRRTEGGRLSHQMV